MQRIEGRTFIYNCSLDDMSFRVERNTWTVVKSQTDVEDNATNDKDSCECLPTRSVQNSTPTVQAVDHWNRQGDVEMIRLRRLDREEKA